MVTSLKFRNTKASGFSNCTEQDEFQNIIRRIYYSRDFQYNLKIISRGGNKMRLIRLSVCIFVALAVSIMTGCGCGRNPLNPSTESPFHIPDDISHETPDGSIHACLGYFGMIVDTANMSASMIPMRSAELHVNVVGVMNNTMGVSVVGVPSEADPSNGLFVFDITLTHPFPIKPQLLGFDVRGILITPGTFSIPPLTFAGLDETRLENADGYTRWWNPTEFTAPGMFGYTKGNLTNTPAEMLTAMINPYKYYADILLVTDEPITYMEKVIAEPLDSDKGRGVFRAGNSNTRRYRIRFPMDPGPQVVYGYAIDASWSKPSPVPPNEIPDDFPMVANLPEAYFVYPKITANSLYYDEETGNSGGVLRMDLMVFDWQGQAIGDVSGQVDVVRAFAPELFAGGISATLKGSFSHCAEYMWDFYPTAVPSQSGKALLAIRVVSKDGPGYDQGVAPAPSGKVEAWQVTEIEILDPECESDDNNDFSEAVEIYYKDSKTGVVCRTVDQKDYYYFVVSPGATVEGELRVYSDAGPVMVRVYDYTHKLIGVSHVSGVGPNMLMDWKPLPGTYYIEVSSETVDDPLVYLVDFNAKWVDVHPDNPVELTSSTLFVNPNLVWMDGDLVAMAGFRCVWVYDLFDPANPVQLSYIDTVESGMNTDACFSDWFMYKSRTEPGGIFYIDWVDFADLYNPEVHESVISYSSSTLNSLCMDSDYLYIAYWGGTAYDIDIFDYKTDPANPVLLTSVSTPEMISCMTSTEIGGYGKFLIVGGSKIIRAFCIEDLSSIDEVVPYPFVSGFPTDIETIGDKIYLSYNKGSNDGHFYIMELEPGMPGFFLCGDVDLPGWGRAVELDILYAYIADGTQGVTIVDISNLANPVVAYSLSLVSRSEDVAFSDNILCVAMFGTGMQAYDMTNPMSPVAYPKLKVCNAAYYGVFQSDYIYVIDKASGYVSLKTLDTSDPENPLLASELHMPDSVRYIDVCGGRIVTSQDVAGNYKWILIDCTDPLNLSILEQISLGNLITEVAITSDAIYIAELGTGVRVYDYSGVHPVQTDLISPSSKVNAIEFHQGYMYLLCLEGVEIYSIANPLHPFYSGAYPATAGVEDGRILYDTLILCQQTKIETADLSDPSLPTYLGSVNPGFSSNMVDIDIEGAYAYTINPGDSTKVFSIWPPESPHYVCPLYNHETLLENDVLVKDGYLYLLSPEYGVRIFDLY